MSTTLKSFQSLYLRASTKLDDLCRPNPKYTPRPSEREICHQRNKSIVKIYLCIIGYFLFSALIRNGPVGDNLLRAFFGVLCISYLFLSCRYHPQIFKVYYSLMCLSYGISAIHSSPEGIYTSYAFTLIIPLFILLITGSFAYFLLQIAAANILLNTYYYGKMREQLIISTPEEILTNLTYACNVAMVMQLLSLGLMGQFIVQAFQKALELEQKKNEAENQKIFLLGFSHELRNLVNSLTGNVKLASLEALGERAREFLQNAEVCGELLQHMINNILDTGKSQIGELEINMTPTNTFDGFERIWAICSELIRRKDLTGHMKISKNLPRTLMMDHHRLTQIFLNLVGNAIKFTEKGSINITLEWLSHKQAVKEECFQPYPFNFTDEQDEGLFEKQQGFSTLCDDWYTLTFKNQKIGKINQPSTYSRGGILKIIVNDTGCGMTNEQTSQLFQKFAQVTTDESKRKLGTGLGLFITRQLCQKMHGEIRVFSEKSKGSAFIVCLPAVTTHEAFHAYDDLDSLKANLAIQNLKAMIVDDALLTHIILKNFFEKLSFQVNDIAVNGLEAYQKYVTHINNGDPFQVITMDLDMPIMNGKEAAQKIREFEKDRGIKPCFLVIISGNCIESEVTECLDKQGLIRADAFIRKPLKLEDFVRVVASRFLDSSK